MPKRHFLHDRTTGQKYAVNGVQFSKNDSSIPELNKDFSTCVSSNTGPLPPRVDLRFAMTPVECQAKINSW